MNEQEQMDNFVGLSSVLTGFSSSIIAPFIDPINIKADYFAKCSQELDDFGQLLTDFATCKSQHKTPEDIGNCIRGKHDMACKKIIFLWYSGAWPNVETVMENGNEKITVSSTLLSSKSYTQGLAWQVMQSHPMGDSNYTYGYWNEEPAPLSGYTGNKND